MSKQVWMVRAGRDAVYVEDFLSLHIVAIGWSGVGDLSAVHGREQIALLLEQRFPEYNKYQISTNAGQIHRFRDELLVGKTVITYDSNKRVYYIGIIEGDYLYRPDLPEHLQHTPLVKWTERKIERDELTPATKRSLGSIATIFRASESASEELLSISKTEAPIPSAQPIAEETVQDAEAEVRQDTEQSALEFLQDRLSKLAWDEMQELVAGLLRAMGYKTRVSPPGPDRGKDIIASPDGFGFQSPRIVIEVKHRKGKMDVKEIRSFANGLRHNDNGLYVSTGGFTREAHYEADRATHPLTLMDADDLGKAIIEHYDQMDMESRALLPLRKIYWPI